MLTGANLGLLILKLIIMLDRLFFGYVNDLSFALFCAKTWCIINDIHVRTSVNHLSYADDLYYVCEPFRFTAIN